MIRYCPDVIPQQELTLFAPQNFGSIGPAGRSGIAKAVLYR